MGLFPSEAEVRRRRRDRSMAAMLYTEPDDYSEPRGTKEGKTAGTNEAKARRKRGLEDTLASARELQRIEDEMDDEPILSAVLTASAARKPRGDKNSKKDTRKGEDSRKEEKMKGDPGDQNDGKRARSADTQDTSTRPTQNPRAPIKIVNLINDLSTQALVSELARRCALSGGEMATDIVEAALRAIRQLSKIGGMPLVLAAATEGDAMALALLSVILCDTMGRALSRVNVRRISVTLWSLVVSGGLSLHAAMQRLTNTAALIEEGDGILSSVIEAVVERAVLAYTKLSVGFIVGAYTIVTIPAYCKVLELNIVKFTSSLWGSVQGAGLRHVLGAFSILILIAAVLQIIIATHAHMRRSKPGGTTRRIEDSVNRAVSAIRTKWNFKKAKVGLLVMLTSVAADMISSAVYTERGVCLSDGPIPHVARQLGIFPDSSQAVISGLLDVIGKPSSKVRVWVWSNIAPLHTAATDFIRNNISTIYQEPSRPRIGNDSSSVPEDTAGSDPDNDSDNGSDNGSDNDSDNGSDIPVEEPQYTKAQAAHWTVVLTSALNNATDTSVSPIGLDSMIELYQVTKEAASVITEAGVTARARGLAPWDSEQSLRAAHDSAKTFAIGGKYDANFQDALNLCFLKLQEMHRQWTTEFQKLDEGNEGNGLDPARLMHLAATATCSKSGPAGPAGPSEEIADITRKLEDLRNKITNAASPAAAMITSLLEKLCHKNPPTAEPTRDYSGLSSALARWETISPNSPTMDDLEQVSRELLVRENLNVPAWTSLEEIQVAIKHLEGLASGSELVKKLLERIKARFDEYQKWDGHLRIILEKAGLSLDALPNIVQIYSLAERALPNDKMPYKRTVYGAIERDNDRAPVKVSADAGPTDSPNQALIDQLLVIDKAILEKQPDVTRDPAGHETYEEHRYELADFIARISGYKGEYLAPSVTDKLYALSVKVASAKAIGDTAELRNALRTFVEENKNENGFKAFLPILKGKDPTEAIAPYNGSDLKLNAAHRVYEAWKELTGRVYAHTSSSKGVIDFIDDSSTGSMFFQMPPDVVFSELRRVWGATSITVDGNTVVDVSLYKQPQMAAEALAPKMQSTFLAQTYARVVGSWDHLLKEITKALGESAKHSIGFSTLTYGGYTYDIMKIIGASARPASSDHALKFSQGLGGLYTYQNFKSASEVLGAFPGSKTDGVLDLTARLAALDYELTKKPSSNSIVYARYALTAYIGTLLGLPDPLAWAENKPKSALAAHVIKDAHAKLLLEPTVENAARVVQLIPTLVISESDMNPLWAELNVTKTAPGVRFLSDMIGYNTKLVTKIYIDNLQKINGTYSKVYELAQLSEQKALDALWKYAAEAAASVIDSTAANKPEPGTEEHARYEAILNERRRYYTEPINAAVLKILRKHYIGDGA